VWQCPVCSEELGDYNAYCEYCLIRENTKVFNPDKHYIRDVCIYSITVGGAKPMTPQEELFAKLFNHEKSLVQDMDVLTLRAHREELSQIAFEARARLTAVDDEEQTRKKKANGESKPTGFERSLNEDDTARSAINAIKGREDKLSKKERVLAGLKKLYELAGASISETDAAKLVAAGTILARVKEKPTELDGIPPKTESRKLVNPFEKPATQENEQ
jgi:hypothetical protein